MQKTSYYIVNGITLYRVIAAFVLLYFIIQKQPEVMKWLLAVSFFTDAIDGFLARRYKVVSVMGSRLDSIGDDLTVLMGVIGIAVFAPEFLRSELPIVVFVLILFVAQITLAIIRYGKVTSFHTYLAKAAALAQGVFLILFFFLPEWPLTLFYIAAIITAFDLIEEIILVIILPKWRADVKGIYWALRDKNA